MALIFAPPKDLIPPALLTSSTAIFMAFTHIWPKRAAEPEVGYRTPTFTSLAAAARTPRRGSPAKPAPTPRAAAPFRKSRRLTGSRNRTRCPFFMVSSSLRGSVLPLRQGCRLCETRPESQSPSHHHAAVHVQDLAGDAL